MMMMMEWKVAFLKQFKDLLRMQFERGHFIAEWSSVASQYFESFGVCGTLKYLKTNYNSFFSC